MKDRPVYIYGLSEPDALWNIRYVGKVLAKPGEGPQQAIERRLQWHVYECHKKTNRTRRHNWLRSLASRGLSASYRLIDIGDLATWGYLERFYIAAYRSAGFDLLNASDGGDGIAGYVATPEHRHKISMAGKGRKQRPEWVAKRIAPLKGRKHRPESIAKMSAAKKGKAPRRKEGWVVPDHVREAVSKANKGRKWSPDSIAKREATKAAKRANGEYPSRKGCMLPPEAIKKVAVANRGRKATPERRKHISEGLKRHWASNPITHCVHGHAYTPENTYVDPKGHNRCRICRAESWRRSRSQRRGCD